jgi:hypothetical protein
MFQVSDLAGSRRREFLDEAKAGSASLRDTDGSVLVMVDSSVIRVLRETASTTALVFAAEAAVRGHRTSPSELGGLAWLAEFDEDDQLQALTELKDAIVIAISSGDIAPIQETIHAWATTAKVMRDPKRRAILSGTPDDSDFEQAAEPNARVSA